MIAKDYINTQLADLATRFANITIKYEFNELIQTHIVELSPSEEYYNNKALDEAWIIIANEFLEKYPTENVSFISTDSTLKVENPEFAFNINKSISFPLLHQDIYQLYLLFSTQIDWGKVSIPHFISFKTIQDINALNTLANNVLPNIGNIDLELFTENVSGYNLVTSAELPIELTSPVDITYALAA